jgi:hypothetical protein
MTMPNDHPNADLPAIVDSATAGDAPISFVLSVLLALSEMAHLEAEGDEETPAAPVNPGGSIEPSAEAISSSQGLARGLAAGPAGPRRLAPDSSWSSWSVLALERAVARLGIAVPCLVAPPDRFH